MPFALGTSRRSFLGNAADAPQPTATDLRNGAVLDIGLYHLAYVGSAEICESLLGSFGGIELFFLADVL